MDNKYIKWGLISLVILSGAGIVYWELSKKVVPTKKPIPDTGGRLPATNKINGGTVSGQSDASGSFPLQKGVKDNAYVGQLQDVLGVTIDNNFGSITLAALQDQVGVSSVASLDDLNTIEDTILAKDTSDNTISLNSTLSQNLISSASSCSYLKTLAATVWHQVQLDMNENFISAGYQISFSKGKEITLKDYTPFGIDPSDGYLIIVCNKGNNAGEWKANPNDLTLI